MEKAKPSKKKAYYKNRKPEASASSNKHVDWRKVGKGDNDRDLAEGSRPRSLQQPESRLADLDEIWQETHVGQDFETLVNVPLSAAGHFVFKSEKNWTLDASKYDDFFSVDVKNLANIVECIPYNRYVQVEDKYFTRDELTAINNTAEQAKKAYDLMLESLRKDNVESCTADCDRLASSEVMDDFSLEDPKQLSNRAADSKKQQVDPQNIEEDLDFLLSLKEPVRSLAVNVGQPIKSNSEEGKTKNIPAATKSIDLEKWLDLVLED